MALIPLTITDTDHRLYTGYAPAGVAVDGRGKVWTAGMSTNDAWRISPYTNAPDLRVSLGAGCYPYDYSDMTGSTLASTPALGQYLFARETTCTIPPPAADAVCLCCLLRTGTIIITHDSGINNFRWGRAQWSQEIPAGSSLTITAKAANRTQDFMDRLSFPIVPHQLFDDVELSTGRFIEITFRSQSMSFLFCVLSCSLMCSCYLHVVSCVHFHCTE